MIYSSAIRFCSDCGNVLFLYEPKDKSNGILYKCRACDFSEIQSSKDTAMIYQKKAKPLTTQQSTFKDYIDDHTIPRVSGVICPNCRHNEAIVFNSFSLSENKLEFYYICTRVENKKKCAFQWQP